MDDKTQHSIDNNSGELISFINKERLPKKVNFKKSFRYFSKCLRKSIIEMNCKFKELSNINESIISGINMIYHIYFILIIFILYLFKLFIIISIIS